MNMSMDRLGVGAAARVNEALRDAERTLTPRDHLMRLGLWALISLNVGAAFSQGDEGAQLLLHLDEFTSAILDSSAKRSVLSDALERTTRGAAANDTLKLQLLDTPGFFDRLVEIIGSASHAASVRNHAVKLLEAMSASAEAQRAFVAHEPQEHGVVTARVKSRGSMIPSLARRQSHTVPFASSQKASCPATKTSGRSGGFGSPVNIAHSHASVLSNQS